MSAPAPAGSPGFPAFPRRAPAALERAAGRVQSLRPVPAGWEKESGRTGCSPIPPPPRRSPAGDGDSGKHHSSRGGLRTGNAEQDRQRSQFLEEIRRSASERMQRKAGE